MDDGVRINKFLGSAGYCSRREADRLVGEGRVFIDGNMADMGSRVMPGQKVYVDGKAVVPEEENILIAVNKPRGIVCTTTDKQGANNIVDFLGCDKRIYPVGRLDKDSEGLLLMTNDGELMNNILTGKNEHEKEYIVEVDKNLSDDFERRMSEPMYLKELDKTTRPCRVIMTGKKTFRIILKQGLNRQIRRMCSNLGYKVVKLKRIRIMNIELNDLPAGATRKIEGSEYEKLMNLINKK
ncbi:MAG: pseudouridine synthase [Lachnospira sp.]|nr:pseudouridine synthase [Lachnospira sp.]